MIRAIEAKNRTDELVKKDVLDKELIEQQEREEAQSAYTQVLKNIEGQILETITNRKYSFVFAFNTWMKGKYLLEPVSKELVASGYAVENLTYSSYDNGQYICDIYQIRVTFLSVGQKKD